MADGTILGDGGLRKRSMLGWKRLRSVLDLLSLKHLWGTHREGHYQHSTDTWAVESEGSPTSKQEGPRVWP